MGIVKNIGMGIVLAGLADILLYTNINAQPAAVSGTILNRKNDPLEKILVQATEVNNPLNKIFTFSSQDGTFTLNDLPTPVTDFPNIIIPDKFQLFENYPEPFNPLTKIDYNMQKQGRVRIDVYNELGQYIRNLVNQVQPAGLNYVLWDGRNNNGLIVSQGVYFYRMIADDFTQTKSMVLLHGVNTPEPRAKQYTEEKSLGKAATKYYDFIFLGDNIQSLTLNDIAVTKDTSLGNIIVNEGPWIKKNIPETAIDDTSKIVIDLEEYFSNDDKSLFTASKGEVNGSVFTFAPGQSDNTQHEEITIEAIDSSYTSLKVSDILRVTVNPCNKKTITGIIKDLMTELPLDSAVVKVGNDSAYTANGNYSLTLILPEETVIEIRKNGYFTRTAEVNGLIHNDMLVPHPTIASADTFKAFCEEANFREGSNTLTYRGLKTMFGNPNAEYWISSHWDLGEGGRATKEEQTYVDSLIVYEIYPNIKPKNRLPIYKENPDSIETIPYNQGKTLVLPRNHPGFYIASWDDNKDGIIDGNEIQLAQNQWNETYKGQILEELLSALVAPNEVSNYSGLTVLRGSKGIITEFDRMLIKICEYFQPKEQIDNILGK